MISIDLAANGEADVNLTVSTADSWETQSNQACHPLSSLPSAPAPAPAPAPFGFGRILNGNGLTERISFFFFFLFLFLFLFSIFFSIEDLEWSCQVS